ncbi:MAG: glycoside hydrolase family 20 zincin-like fold domain-containing protein [Deinococcota bacterium]
MTYVEDAYAPRTARAEIVPTPQEETLGESVFQLPAQTTLWLAEPTPALHQAADDLQMTVERVSEVTLSVLEATSSDTPDDSTDGVDAAHIRVWSLNADGNARLEALNITPVNQAEGYVLAIHDGGIDIIGADERGMFYGLMSLQQLVRAGTDLQTRIVRDYPDLSWRVAMIYLDANATINETLIPILAQHKLNAVLVMSNYLEWDSAPELHMPGSASKELAQRTVDTARRYLMEPIPLLETFGHVQWLFQNNQNNDLLLDPSAQSRFAYNPLEPRTYDVLLPLIDEVVDLFKPRFFHIGHDEIRNVVPFPAAGVSFVDAFVDDIQRLYNHLAADGIQVMIWHDTLLAADVVPALSRLPDDLIITSWNYNPAPNYPTIDTLQEAGFEVLGASWFEPDNIFTYARYAHARDALGMIQTRWTGYFGNSSLLAGQFPQAYAYLTAAQSFWNPQADPLEDAAIRFREAWAWRTEAARSRETSAGYLLDLSQQANRHLVASEGQAWLGRGPDYDMRALVEASQEDTFRLAGVRFALGPVISLQGRHRRVVNDPEQVRLTLNRPAARLALLHTSGWSSADTGDDIGRYVVHYEDGSSTPIPLFYNVNISAWTELEVTAISLGQVWRGQAPNGLGVSADLLMWDNPFPERNISHIEFMSANTMANPMLLGLTVLEN